MRKENQPIVRRSLLLIVAFAATACAPAAPDQWTKQEADHYLNLQFASHNADASKGIVAGIAYPFAVHSGMKVLQQGGTAADAAITASLTQIAMTAGATVSYAGVIDVVYYDSASDKVYTLNAAYNTVKDEMDPLTIPSPGEPSGRTALVPGFMAGVQALHDRFGKLPFAALFRPAIWIAEHGMPFSRELDSWLTQSKDFIGRLPETRKVFTKPDQQFYKQGDWFRQPALAETLKKVAAQGSQYMYKGDWAHHFVEAVEREGGKMTMDDLASYQAMWTEPLRMQYRGYEVVSLGSPNYGGAIMLDGLKFAQTVDFKKQLHYSQSPDSLADIVQIGRAALDKMNADFVPRSAHSSAIIAVDEHGNVASVLHSINTSLWGSTGIFVDGVSIPDSGAINQRVILAAGPGTRLFEGMNPLIVLKQGTPYLASSAVGGGLHQVTLQNLINVLDFGMDVASAVVQPNTYGAMWTNDRIEAADSGFSTTVLDGVRARGQQIEVVKDYAQTGYWVGVQIRPLLVHKLGGATNQKIPGFVEGY